MISLTKFRTLNTKLQEKLLWCHGINLDLFKQKGRIEVTLFALYEFYVEIKFDRATCELLQMKCFRCTKQLDPYLQMINISELTKVINNENG